MKWKLEPLDNTSRIRIGTGIPAVGRLLLWVPEAITSNTGISSIYPIGTWMRNDTRLWQHVSGESTIGPGNFLKVDESTFECVGIRMPADGPVEWTATIVAHECAVDFCIRLTNLGEQTLHKAGGAICLKFLDAPWWSDEDTYVLSSGSMVSLASLGINAGQSNTFQAYLIADQSYDHVFYREFWGFNRRQLDKPFMISENVHEKVCTIIQADRAYFLHSNRGNPCTDLMLFFGDVEPKASSQAEGRVCIKRGRATDVIKELGF